ncbi:MAG: hypothetical protein V2J20_05370 [Wenzhouxiangella sp.]|jgi:hypothetical protein|nr:hypothetical protein [Wenzhouxiangella sp.]
MKYLLSAACLLVLAACGNSEPDAEELLAPQLEAMERAKEVEQVLDDAAERQRRQIEEQGG